MERKSQIALWMLTKFAMVFFILALAVILLGIANSEKEGLCSGRAQALASGIRADLVNVLSSPMEDERKVISLERVLSIGKEDFARYEINITSHNPTSSSPSLIIDVAPLNSKECRGGSSLGYERDVTINLKGGQISQSTAGEALTLTPSSPDSQSYYLVLIKCRTKEWPPDRNLFIEDCKRSNPDECYTFASFPEECGWPNGNQSS